MTEQKDHDIRDNFINAGLLIVVLAALTVIYDHFEERKKERAKFNPDPISQRFPFDYDNNSGDYYDYLDSLEYRELPDRWDDYEDTELEEYRQSLYYQALSDNAYYATQQAAIEPDWNDLEPTPDRSWMTHGVPTSNEDYLVPYDYGTEDDE